MLGTIFNLFGQASFFVLGVYIQKFIRKHFFSRETRKRIKQTMRISACAIMTILLLFHNYQEYCEPLQIKEASCFYLQFDIYQIFQVFFANSILFGYHIYEKFVKGHPNWERYNIKNVFIAPILEELIFRASFYRIASHQISIFLMAFIFSISHLHKPIRKTIKGKEAYWSGAYGQVVFTYIFGIYSFYFLSTWQSVIPSIVLHCYCNFLGPPSIRKDNLKYHLLCILGIISYCTIFISQ